MGYIDETFCVGSDGHKHYRAHNTKSPLGLCRGKLGNGEHLSFEAYKYKENIIYVIIIMLHREHINFYPETHFYRHNYCRFEVMTHKIRCRRSAITCIAGGKCERIMCNGCVRLPNFDLLIISLFMERILFVSY